MSGETKVSAASNINSHQMGPTIIKQMQHRVFLSLMPFYVCTCVHV